MAAPLAIGLIRGSLPSYFPARHRVFERSEAMLASLCEEVGARLHIAPGTPIDGREAQAAVDGCLAEGADFVLLLHGGFTMGDVARTVAASGLRMGVWATVEPVLEGDIQLNNFVSLNMSLSIARGARDLERRPVQWYFGDPEDPALQARLRTSLRALSMIKRLAGARIGLVGGLAPTFYNMEVSTSALTQRLGLDVEAVDMSAMVGRMAALDEKRVDQEVEKMAAAAPVQGVSPEQMALTGRAALALRELAGEHAFDALAVSDWPALQEDPGMHPGAAFTWLEEVDCLPVASEGDVLGAATQLAASALTGRVGYLLDMTEPDPGAGDLLMWHGGGGPLYLADAGGAAWINHPMIGRGTEGGPRYGAVADLVFRDGPVTVFRIARDAGALFAMEARVAGRTPTGFDGCRGWLRDFSIDGDAASLHDVLATVMGHGLEHHFILVPGRHGDVLAEFAAWTGQSLLGRIPYRTHLTPPI